MAGLFSKIFGGLSKIDDDFYEEIFEKLVMGDVVVRTSEEIFEKLKVQVKENHIKDPEDCREHLKDLIKNEMRLDEDAYAFEKEFKFREKYSGFSVILVAVWQGAKP